MAASLFLYGLIPLVLFVLIDTFAGIKLALAITFGAAIVEIFVIYDNTGEWDRLSFIAAGLILTLGYLTWKSGNRKYLKFQPVILSILLAIFLAYLQLSDRPLIVRYGLLIQQLLPEQFRSYLNNPEFVSLLNFFVNWAIILFLVNALLIAYTAIYRSSWVWIITRGFGFWILSLMMLILQFCYLYFFYKG